MAHAEVLLHPVLAERLLAAVMARYPTKTFGYLLSAGKPHAPSDFMIFEGNVRNDRKWRLRFEAYGRYFVDHDDAGFVAAPQETWRIQKRIERLGLEEVALFHTHQRHPANFSRIDYDLHVVNSSTLWHLVISLRNSKRPRLRAFAVADSGVTELPIVSLAHNRATTEAGRAVGKTRCGEPIRRRCSTRPSPPSDKRLVLQLAEAMAFGDARASEQLVARAADERARARYEEEIEPLLVSISSAEFEMGTPTARAAHFCGESPSHRVTVSSYRISREAVTNEMFARFDPRRRELPARDRRKPVTNVSWIEAAAYAAWVGCRLPTEAEWEYACGTGSECEWFAGTESELRRYAWYSDNAEGRVRPVANLEPNAFGLSDLHGNVWEWCVDTYSPDYYSRSPRRDPVNLTGPGAASTAFVAATHRVCRGGSIHALAEMCRTRYRLHEPAAFEASDLGFRLAATSSVGY